MNPDFPEFNDILWLQRPFTSAEIISISSHHSVGVLQLVNFPYITVILDPCANEVYFAEFTILNSY